MPTTCPRHAIPLPRLLLSTVPYIKGARICNGVPRRHASLFFPLALACMNTWFVVSPHFARASCVPGVLFASALTAHFDAIPLCASATMSCPLGPAGGGGAESHRRCRSSRSRPGEVANAAYYTTGLCPAQVHVGCRPRQICPFSCLGKVHCSTTLNLFQSHIVCALCKRAQTHKPSASIFQTVLARWLIRDTCAFRHRSDRLVQGGCCKGQGGALHRQELRAGAFQC